MVKDIIYLENILDGFKSICKIYHEYIHHSQEYVVYKTHYKLIITKDDRVRLYNCNTYVYLDFNDVWDDLPELFKNEAIFNLEIFK